MTTKTRHELRQEGINKVYKWFAVDGNPQAKSIGGGCYYDRWMSHLLENQDDPKEGRCAVGCQMTTDELTEFHKHDYVYVSGIESVDTYNNMPPHIKGQGQDYLMALQQCHDGATTDNFLQEFTNNLQDLCIEYDLVYPGDKP